MRWKREKHLKRARWRAAVEEPNIAVAAAFDYNDADATKRFESAVHSANIGATDHEQLEASDVPLVLGPEECWLPMEDLDIDMLLKVRDPTAHDETMNDWYDVLHQIIADCVSHLDPVGEERSCLKPTCGRLWRRHQCK